MSHVESEKSLRVKVDGSWEDFSFRLEGPDKLPRSLSEWWRPALVAALKRSHGPGVLRQLSTGFFVWDRI